MPVGLGTIPVDPSLEDGGASLRVTIANHFQFRTKMLLEYQCQQKQEAPKQTKLIGALSKCGQKLAAADWALHAKRDLFSSCCDCSLTLEGVPAQLARCDQL